MSHSRTLVISDLHLGVNRTGGTTTQSLEALREYAHSKHAELLQVAVSHGCGRVLVNGDLTDTYSIPLTEALKLYETADNFMSDNPAKELVWSLGNHDVSKDSSKLGTVAFIGALLGMKYPERFTLVDKPRRIDNIYVLPHCANQEIFQLEISRIPENVQYCAIHANFDNSFAMQSDGSLNLDRATAKVLAKRMTLIFGHEHQGRSLMGDKVVIVGNNFSQSVSDCLSHGDSQKDGKKYCLVIDGDDMELVQTWSCNDEVGGFTEVDWQDLQGCKANGFVRVKGEANAAQAAEVIKSISRFRQASPAFVITNAVKVEGSGTDESFAESVEDIRAVNVIEMLIETLGAEQAACVRKLLKENTNG